MCLAIFVIQTSVALSVIVIHYVNRYKPTKCVDYTIAVSATENESLCHVLTIVDMMIFCLKLLFWQ